MGDDPSTVPPRGWPELKEDVMAAERIVTSPVATPAETTRVSGVHAEGLLAGVVGAATIALWFLVLDLVQGRPLYTPTVLGTALLRGGEGLASPETLPVSLEVVLPFTWIHLLVFLVLGVAASWLLGLAERNPSFGFGIVLFFVVFEFGFVALCMLVAEPVLHALAWPAVLVGNLLAAGAMAGLFWRRHPRLAIHP
jgi:hypothetical protein